MNKCGTLYICPTPIGNLEDMTLRTIRILNEVDLIAAEDTRHSRKLLNHLEIDTKMISYHEHNKFKVEDSIIYKLKDGLNIALISDAGMPGISDPGEEIIKRAIEEGIELYCLPGPSALVNAVVLSGLSTRRFAFEGFLDRNKKERKQRLERIKYDDRTLIFYEAPHRLKDTLKDMLEILGDRNIVCARELTKKFEEYKRFKISEMLNIYSSAENPRGEYVVVVEGASEEEYQKILDSEFDSLSIEEHIVKLVDEGMRKKDAVKEVAKLRKIPKSDVYKYSIDL
ncbi:MAG: 16S rRNA (cytidine(1402)-2'-O)-methyltransferase [Acidaminobacteraceae bacterium]